MSLRPIVPLTGRPPQDLGFGSVVADATQRRFLNRDGTFNVKRTGLSFVESRSPYRYVLDISWPTFILHVVSWYLITNAIFALAYHDGETGSGPCRGDAVNPVYRPARARRSRDWA
jgi:hypothetical protein